MDSNIAIVDIDQRSQEVLGRWPFSRVHFAHMLDALREDGAAVVAFDITFSKPEDASVAPIREMRDELSNLQRQGAKPDSRFAARLAHLEAKYDADAQFARSLQEFGAVVLGNYFLYSSSDLAGVDGATLDRYAELLSFFPFPRVQPLRPQAHQQDFARLVEYYGSSGLLPRGAEANLGVFTNAIGGDQGGATGFFNVPPDTDGVVRHSLLAIPYGRTPDTDAWDFYASLDVQAVRLFLNRPDTVLTFGPVGIARLEVGPALQLQPDPLARTMINYRGPVHTYPYYSIADVVQRTFRKDSFRGKIVLVGASATGIGDMRPTPYGGLNFPGVEVHANVIDNLLHESFLQRGPRQVVWDLAFLLLFGIPVGLWVAASRPQSMWFALFLAIPFIIGVYQAFLKGWWLNLTLPLLTLVGNVSLVALYRVVVEEREKRRVRGSFQQYLSPEVIRRLLEQPKLVQPRKTEVTVMFSDIRNFTTISEQLDAQDLALLLNGYLSDMTRIVFNTQGTLDKYIGDAVMAFWGAPFEESDHAVRSCRAALAMMQRVAELREEWQAAGHPRLDIGIGLNTGTASVGNMGSKLRYGYTAMGDVVNLSSRLEALNKEFRTHILAGPATYDAARNAGFLFRELDLIQVHGKLKPVTIYELIGWQEEAVQHAERLSEFVRARTCYLQRDWLEAQKIFQSILDRWPDDGPSRTYWKRCQDYLFEAPTESWDGVFVMTHK
jgi:adenylate cyclase